jgi:hypothetical protein
MKTEGSFSMRKRMFDDSPAAALRHSTLANELDLRSCAQVHFSSEDPEHPIDRLFDGSTGDSASGWVGGRRDRAETILLVFDQPTDVASCVFEVVERKIARTQQVTAEYLLSGDHAYRTSFVQEFNFSPDGATYQRELMELNLRSVCRFRITLLADKSGRGVPSLKALRLFSFAL